MGGSWRNCKVNVCNTVPMINLVLAIFHFHKDHSVLMLDLVLQVAASRRLIWMCMRFPLQHVLIVHVHAHLISMNAGSADCLPALDHQKATVETVVSWREIRYAYAYACHQRALAFPS